MAQANQPNEEKLQIIARILTLSGTLPFVGVTLLAVMDWQWLTLPMGTVLFIYAAVIASFISGIHWAFALMGHQRIDLLWKSNLVTLLAWLAALQIFQTSAWLLLFCFSYLILIDYDLFKQRIIQAWFWRLRLQASAIVMICILIFSLIKPH